MALLLSQRFQRKRKKLKTMAKIEVNVAELVSRLGGMRKSILEQIDRTKKEIKAYDQVTEFIENTLQTAGCVPTDKERKACDVQVPLGQGIYCPGECDASTVLVNVGLGYFVEYPAEQALDVLQTLRNFKVKKSTLLESGIASCDSAILCAIAGTKYASDNFFS